MNERFKILELLSTTRGRVNRCRCISPYISFKLVNNVESINCVNCFS